jgi:ornithine cyclodeaminase/alanine dehydrogenase-like protein (mu-crystallin family)
MLTLSEDQVRQNLEVDEVLRALEQMFGRDYETTAILPQRIQMQMGAGSTCLIMPCSDRAIPGTGVKVVTVREGMQVDGDRVQANYFLLESATGKVCASLSANHLTEVRTAAVSAIATKFLARPEAKTLGVFGTGRQALAHLLLLTRVHRYERILVCGSRKSQSEAFKLLAGEDHDLVVEAVDSNTCAGEADVICTCTTSKVPIFDGRWVREGTHLNLVGGFQPDGREVDDLVVSRSRIVVDTFEGALAEAGDLLIPLHNNIITKEHIIGDLHQIVSGRLVARNDQDEITIFKSVGFALEDLVVASLLYDRLRLHQERAAASP